MEGVEERNGEGRREKSVERSNGLGRGGENRGRNGGRNGTWKTNGVKQEMEKGRENRVWKEVMDRVTKGEIEGGMKRGGMEVVERRNYPLKEMGRGIFGD